MFISHIRKSLYAYLFEGGCGKKGPRAATGRYWRYLFKHLTQSGGEVLRIQQSEADPCGGELRARCSSAEGRSLSAGRQEKKLNVRLTRRRRETSWSPQSPQTVDQELLVVRRKGKEETTEVT